VRVSWDQALDLVANEVKRVVTQFGNSSIYGGSYGWGTSGKLNNAIVPLYRFLGLYGGFTYLVNSYSAGADPVIMPHVVGTSFSEDTAWPVVLENTELAVLFGVTPLKSSQVGYTANIVNNEPGWIQKLKASNVEVVYISPQRNDVAEYLRATWIPIRPNTDTALMLGIAHTLLTQNLHDQAFLDKYTVGFQQFSDYLLGKEDGTEKTAQWAAGITGVDAGAIESLAKTMAGKRTMLRLAGSLQRADHGEQPDWMVAVLSAMLGQIGLPGGGYHEWTQSLASQPYYTGPGISGLPAPANPVKDFIPCARIADLLLNPGGTFDYDGKQYTYPDIKLVYWTGGNPFHHHQDVNKLLEAWRRPQSVIVHEAFWTATAKLADIVLPMSDKYEYDDIEASSQYIVAMPKLIEPLFESRTDVDAFTELADRLGFKDKYTEGKTPMQWIQEMYEAAAQKGNAKGLTMPDFATFWNDKGYLEFPVNPDSEKTVAWAQFRENPALNPLGTPSGKIEIYSKTIEGFHYDDCPPHPTWLEPAEWLGSPKTAQYPLHVLSPHPKFRLHSELDNTWIRDWYEVQQREPIWINPQDAQARGIQDGDLVRVFNSRGETLAGASITDRVTPGVIIMHEGGWYDPLDPGKIGTLDKHGNVNAVTLDKGTSKLAQGTIADTALAQVEKYSGSVPAITAFTPPEGAA